MRKLELLLFAMLAGLLLFLIGLAAFYSLRSQEITEKELNESVSARKITNHTPEDPPNEEDPRLAEVSKNKFEYYIIIGSFKTLAQAQHYADAKSKSLNMEIEVLPPAKEDCYRISCGKYPDLTEAEAKLRDVQASIRTDAWILTVKEQ